MTKTAFCGWRARGGTRPFTQLLLVMKLTFFLLTAACLHVSAGALSQNVTFSGKEISLEKVFTAVESQTGYFFLYPSSILRDAKKVTVDAKEMPLAQFLDLVFRDQALKYFIESKTINVSEGEKNTSSVMLPAPTLIPPIDIKGRITNESGEAVAGVSVIVKGTTNGTTTNSNGEFTLSNVDSKAILKISGVNVESVEVAVDNRPLLLLTAKTKVSSLDEVQIIAYGTQTNRNSVGNVSTLKSTDIAKQPISNPLLAMQGRIPGVSITQSSGVSGGGVTVRIQGQNSISKGNDPFYVIDGVPYATRVMPSLGTILKSSGSPADEFGNSLNGSPLSYINSDDIESITVLKDADATAIYGSRAANGAILITTKKGKSGKTSFDVNMKRGIGQVGRKLPLMNTRQYLDMRYQGIKNDGDVIQPYDYDLTLWDTTKYTDLQKELIGGSADYTNINASVSGGTDNTNFLLGIGYYNESTVFPGDFSNRNISFHSTLNHSSKNKRLKVQFVSSYMVGKNQLPKTDLTNYIKLAPNAPDLLSTDGTLNWGLTTDGQVTFGNPLASLNEQFSNTTNNLISNASLSYQIFRGVELSTSLGYTNMNIDEYSLEPLTLYPPSYWQYYSRAANFNSGKSSSWILEPQIRINKKLFRGEMTGLLGGTIQGTDSRAQRIRASGQNSDAVLQDLRAATNISALGRVAANYKYAAVYGRLNNIWSNKYIVELTLRRDGSSRFGSENQFHTFWSAGGAWIVSQENFIKDNLSFLSFAKIKGSYGTTGSDQIGDYQYIKNYSIISGLPYQNIVGIEPGISNPYLQWEENKKLQIGIDLGFFADRLLLTAIYFKNQSSNQLLGVTLPSTTGVGGITQNLPALVENRGIEISLNTVNVKSKNFTWSTSFNYTSLSNKLVSFDNLEKSNQANNLVIGHSVNITKVFHFLGVNPQTGIYEFEDKQKNATSTPNNVEDRNTIVNNLPRYYGGIDNSISFKSFELSFLFQFVKQKGPNDYYGANAGYFGQNQPIWLSDSWRSVGDVTPHQKVSARLSDPILVGAQSAVTSSDAFRTDASYIRLKNIAFSWSLPVSWISKMRAESIRIFLQGQNIVTFTSYKGLDPETLSSGVLPPLRIVTGGIVFKF